MFTFNRAVTSQCVTDTRQCVQETRMLEDPETDDPGSMKEVPLKVNSM